MNSKKGKEVSFSKEELIILNDTSFLKTKIIVTEKVLNLLIETEKKLKAFVKEEKQNFPDNLLIRAGKISKGEKYLNLPYQVLDYPRFFSKESVFTYRTMFWWGNFFSCTLHLQGDALEYYRDALLQNLLHAPLADCYVCVNNTTPWEYHFESSNFVPLNQIPASKLNQILKNHPFIKISRKLPLEKSDDLPAFALDSFKLFYKMLV